MTIDDWEGNSQLVSSDSGVRPSLPAADLHERAACCTGTERTVFPSDLHYTERTVNETIRVVVDDGYHVFAARAGVRPGVGIPAKPNAKSRMIPNGIPG